MDAAEFKFYTEEQVRRKSLADKPFFELGNNFEDHHHLGRQTCPRTYTLHTERHSFISNRLYYLGRKYRKEPIIQLVVNLLAACELLAFELNHILFRIRDDPTRERLDDELCRRCLSLDRIILIVETMMEEFEHGTKQDLRTNIYQKS